MARSPDRQNIIRDTSFFSGSVYVSQIMFFIRGVLNARILGPAVYGLWSALNIILNYSAYVHLGALNAMNREIPYLNGRDSAEEMKKARDVTFTICVVMNLIFSVVLIIIALLLWKSLSLVESIGLIAVAILSFITSIYEFYLTLLIARKSFWVTSKVNVIFSILSVPLTLILVLNFKIYGVYIVAIAVPLLSIFYIWFREPYRSRLIFDLKEMFRLVKIGLPLVSINFLDTAAISIAGIITLGLLGKVNMGYYAVAMLAGRFLTYFPNSINRAFEPHIYQRYGETNNVSELKKYLFKPTLVMALLFPSIAAFYYTGVTFFIRHFLPKYITSMSPFFIILVSRFFVSISPTAVVLLTAVNKQRFLVPVYLFGIAIISGASLIFIKMGFGITGAAFGLLLTCLFTGSVIFIYALSHYIKSPFKCFSYTAKLCLPFLYMMAVLVFTEIIILSSSSLFSDFLRMLTKSVILLVFSLPLIYLANAKTGIISDILGFLRLKRSVLIRPSLYARGG